MLYYLIRYLEAVFEPPGFQVIEYITVRAALAAITALLIALFIGRRIIRWLAQRPRTYLKACCQELDTQSLVSITWHSSSSTSRVAASPWSSTL